MIIGIIGLILGSVATVLVLKPAKSTDEKLRDLKARINADSEIARNNLTRTLCGSEIEQKLRKNKKKTNERERMRKLAEYKARRAQKE
jgi:hypothetical protein